LALGLGLIGAGEVAWAGQAATPSGAVPAAVAGTATPASSAESKAGTPTNANPAIWKVQGPHETVYLFGTIHVMKPDVRWQTPKVEDAFRKSDTLYLEIAKIDDLEAMKPLVMELGMDAGHPLSSKISKDDVGRLDAAVKSMGMPGEEMFEPMQPWLAYLTLQALPMLRAGMSPTSGIDVKLSADAKASAKPVLGFETVSEQAHFFADFPQAEQVNLLHQELDELPKAAEETDQMVADWTSGDVEAIAKMENGAFRDKDPELYRRLVVERNERWADRLATLLKSDKPGVAFVAVGAAHLAGPDSVQHALETRGFKAVRE
jgi:uncharacterized protein YbaP (TraB family)